MTKEINPLDTICDLKWNYPIFNIDRGEFRSCCRTPSNKISREDIENFGTDAFLNSPKMKQSRLDLVNGIRHSDCKTCWQIEDSGMKSPREGPEQFWHLLSKMDKGKVNFNNGEYSDKKLTARLKQIKDIRHPYLESNDPYMLEISLGNTCDMKCMYCNHHYSSQWAAEEIKLGRITQDQYDREFPKASENFEETFWRWLHKIDIGNLHRIGIIGGEPLIMPLFYSFSDRLIEEKSKSSAVLPYGNTRFWIVTNLNTPPNYLEKFFQYLPKLTEQFDVEILVSMESQETRAEYIRNGVNWDRFRGNLDKLLSHKDLKFDFGFLPSLNVLSISRLKEFVMFSEELYNQYGRPVALKQNIINFPNWQSPFILTADFADYVDDCIAYMDTKKDIMPLVPDTYGRWIEFMEFLKPLSKSIRENSIDRYNERKKFVRWYDEFDQKRKLNLLETFPEYTDFYNFCKGL